MQKKVYLTPFASPEAAALKGASLVASGTAGVRGLALATLPSEAVEAGRPPQRRPPSHQPSPYHPLDPPT